MTKPTLALVCLWAFTVAAKPATDRGGQCGQPLDNEPVTGTAIGMDELVAKKPRQGRFVTEGYAQNTYHCQPCPAGASCKPCEEVVWFSPMFGAFKHPLARDQNLVLSVPDARRFERMQRYRVAFVACDVSSNPQAPLVAELRGFEPLKP